MMSSMLDGAKGGILKYIILFFIVLATGGLVLTDVGGFFTGGVSSSAVANIDGDDISIAEFDRDIRNLTYSQGISPQQAYSSGLVQQYLQGLIARNLLQKAAKNSGLRLGPDQMVGEVRQYVEPYINDETTAADAFNNMLRAQNMSEKEFIRILEQDGVNKLMQEILTGATTVPGYMAMDFAEGLGHTRKVSSLVLDINKMPTDAQPTDADLEEFYDSVKETYRTDEVRSFDILVLDVDDVAQKLNITDDQLKSYYDDNIDRFSTAEKRQIEQSLVKDEAVALQIYQLAKDGKSLKDATDAIVGSVKPYRSADSFEENGLLEDLSKHVFGVDANTLIEPIETPLGWHVVKVLTITPSKQQSFASVKETVKKDLRAELLEDQFYELSLEVEETLDSGVTVSEVAEEYNLNVKKLTNLTRYDTSKALDFIDDKARFLELGFDLLEQESSQLLENGDDYYAFTVSEVKPSDYKSFDAVKQSIKQDYLAEQKRIAAQDLIAQSQTAIENGTRTMAEQAKQSSALSYLTINSLRRYGEPPAYISSAQIPLIFDADKGERLLLNSENYYVITEIDSIDLPKNYTLDSRDVTTQGETLNAIMQNTLVESYVFALQNRYKTKVNTHVLDQLYASSGEE